MASKAHIKGSLGIYCPILMYHDQGSPFVEDLEEENCPICGTWAMAEKQSGKKLPLPAFTKDNLKGDPAHILDFLLAGKKILMIEDSPVSMKVLSKTLSPLSSILLKAKDGEEGLNHLVETPDVGLILLDMDMPVMDGATFMDELHNQFGEELPYAVMLVSELSNWKEAKNLINQGVMAYVKKPFGKKELYQTAIHCMLQLEERIA